MADGHKLRDVRGIVQLPRFYFAMATTVLGPALRVERAIVRPLCPWHSQG